MSALRSVGPKWVSLKEATARRPVGLRTLRRWVKEGRLRSVELPWRGGSKVVTTLGWVDEAMLAQERPRVTSTSMERAS